MDPFEDIFEESSVINAPAIGKFQPRAKPRPKKAAACKLVSSVHANTKKSISVPSSSDLDAAHCANPLDFADQGSENPGIPSSDLADTVIETGDLLKTNEDSRLGIPVIDENKISQTTNTSSQPEYPCSGSENPVCDSRLMFEDPMHLQVATSDGCSNPSFVKSGAENADIYSELELDCLDDFITQSTSGAGVATDNVHPRFDIGGQPVNKFSYPVNNDGEGSFSPSEAPTLNASDNMETNEIKHFSGHHPHDLLASSTCDAAETQSSAGDCMTQELGTFCETSVPNQNGEYWIDNRKSNTEIFGTEVGSEFERVDMMPEVTTFPVMRAGKYQPKPKNKMGKCSTSIRDSGAVDSVMGHGDLQSRPPESKQVHEDLGPAFPVNGVDGSSGHLDCSLPKDPCDQHLNEALANHDETCNPDVSMPEDVLHSPVVPEKVAKKGKRHSTTSEYSQKPEKSSVPGEENIGAKSSRRQRKRVGASQPSNETEGRVDNSGDSPAKHPTEFVGTGDKDAENDDENRCENRSGKKNVRGKRKKFSADENSDQKSNKDSKAPRKFPHSTQRKKRCVDKNLLDMPEDEIDYRSLPIKDLIILAEVRERIANKTAAKSNAAPSNQSADNSVRDDFLDYDETFGSEQRGNLADDEGPCAVQPSLSYFNYHSFMDKTRGPRWSKQETELFYEGVQQFGSDLSMIQQLFPGRTRHQVKLKYKNEERRHPLRLHDALENRARDHSHFKMVIEQLQQVAAQAEQDATGDDSVDIGGEDVEELSPEAKKEAAKTEQDEEAPEQNLKPDVDEVHVPVEAHDIDDDDDLWNNYKTGY